MTIPLYVLIPLFALALFAGGVREIWKLGGRPKFRKRGER